MWELLSFLDNESMVQPKILLVEDCRFDTAITKRIIEEHYSYSIIHHAENRGDACVYLLQHRYDVVLLDLALPDTVSLKDVAEIKKLAKSAPVIVVTGRSTEDITEEIKSYGANGIIAKEHIVGNDFSTIMHDAVHNIEAA